MTMKVVILCGGKGTRMLPLTKEVPKPLVPLNGKPILQHILELYEKNGINDFVLCIGTHGEKIKEFLNDKKHNVIFSDSGGDASMLKRIFDARDKMGERAIVSYADTITNIDINKLLEFHEKKKSIATILVAKIKSPFGLVSYNGEGKCTSFEEKPTFHYYIGHIVLEKKAFEYLAPDLLGMPDGEGLVKFFKQLAGKGLLHVYEHEGLQTTFNTSTERDKAEKELIDFYTFKEE